MTWQDCTLGDLMTLKRGHDLPNAKRKEGKVPVVSSSGITGFHNEAKANPPGVVTGRYGTLGEVFFLNEPYWPLNTALYVVDFKNTNPKFAAYFLKQTLKSYQSDKAAVPGVDRKVLHTLKVKAPSVRKQDKIVETLSAYDDLIEINKRRIALLEESARQLYKEWFVRFRFPGHEHVKIVDGVPEGWEKSSVSDAVLINPKTAVEKGQEIKYVPMSALSESQMTVDTSRFELRTKHTNVKFQRDDTLFARITPCLENGKTAFVSFLKYDEVACGSTEFIVMRTKKISSQYIYLLARDEQFRGHAIKSMVGSSGRQRVQASCFDKFFIAIPPARVQGQFNEVTSNSFKQIANLEYQIEQLKQARDLLLPKLMSGELAV